MINRRDFIKCSCGVAAGAVLAGLGFSSIPSNAYAVAGVDDALVGYALLGVVGTVAGVALGYKTYADIENGTAAEIGASFGAFCSDVANEAQIISEGVSQSAQVAGSVYTEAQLQEIYAKASWADMAVNSLTGLGSDALDFINGRSAEACLAWSAIKMWLAGCSADFPSVVTSGRRPILFGDPINYAASKGYSSIAPIPDYVGYSVADINASGGINYVWGFSTRPTVFYNKSEFDAASDPKVFVSVNNYVISGTTGRYNPGSRRWTTYTGSSTTYNGGRFVFPDMPTILNRPAETVVSPAIDQMLNPPSDLAGYGFGVPVIGTDSVINGDTLEHTGHLLAPGTAGELLKDGSISLPWSDLVWGAGLGVGDGAIARGIEGDASLPLGVSLPADLPVTVSFPVDGTITGVKTLPLEDALTGDIDTSISRTLNPAIPIEGTPFYPVNPPGTNSTPPSTLPNFPFPNIFPFNMLFEWLKWIRDNV